MQQKLHPPLGWEETDIDTFQQDCPTVIAQLGQSLDGQIVTVWGSSRNIHDSASRAHAHRLRTWADVWLMDITTMVTDDLTLGVGNNSDQGPSCVVLISAKAETQVPAWLRTSDAVRKVILATNAVMSAGWPDDIDLVNLGDVQGHISPARVVQWLAQQGWQKILIEDDATTVVNFLQAGCLDYLHLMISPQLIGHGQPKLAVHPVSQLSQTQRFKIRTHALGEDQLVVCDFKASTR